MEERIDINREVFNITKETVTVEDVAKICKKINPNIRLIYTNDEIPNPGFSLSNDKIKRTGFKFLYSLKQSMKEMIENWSSQKLNKDIYTVDYGSDPYEDSRGRINNHELTEPIKLIGYIE